MHTNTFKQTLNLTFPKEMSYRFVDEVIEISENQVIARYTCQPNSIFYKGHFPNNPVTPGSILQEIAVQNGPTILLKFHLFNKGLDLLSYDIYLMGSQVRFKRIVRPGETLLIKTRVLYFKEDLGTMRCRTTIYTEKENELVLFGTFTAQMLKSKKGE